MRYHDERRMLLATPAEVAGAAAALELSRGLLSTTLFDVGGQEEIREFEDALPRIDPKHRAIFETALPIVADPVRSAMFRFHWTGFYTEWFAAWSGDGAMAIMERVGDEIGLRRAEAGEVKAKMLAALSSDVPFEGSDTRFVMEGEDLFVLVAVADALRRQWLESLLAHERSPESVTAEDVALAVQAAMSGDPRWTSCALAKAVPSQLLDGIEVDRALDGLVETGALAMPVEGRFVPSVEAASVLRGIAGASSTVAITVYGATDEGHGYETTLLARDIATVWTVLVSPIESFLAPAGPSALSALLDGALGVVK